MFWQRGPITKQVHVDLPPGTVEEEVGREGFGGPVAHLYRSHPPVDWTHIEGDLKPHALDTANIPRQQDDWRSGRVALLVNQDVTLAVAQLTTPMPYCFRNIDGDELLFVHEGEGHLETDFGQLAYRPGHYIYLPKGTVYRIVPRSQSRFLLTTTTAPLQIPDRGLLGRHALFDLATLQTPDLTPVERPHQPWDLWVQRGHRMSKVTYPHHPITTVGWRGDLAAWSLHIDDIRPILCERYHLPPTAHATFVADGVVICTFLPRALETGDPGALKVPFYHSNVDYDEVLFYHDGDFFSREGIDKGMITFHPAGLPHGPHPGAVEAAKTKQRTDEKAVMVDTRRPLYLTAEGRAACKPNYWRSWMTTPATTFAPPAVLEEAK